jgi:hypothetical protein
MDGVIVRTRHVVCLAGPLEQSPDDPREQHPAGPCGDCAELPRNVFRIVKSAPRKLAGDNGHAQEGENGAVGTSPLSHDGEGWTV